MKDVQGRIAINIIIIAVIAVGLFFVANDFFKEKDMRTNTELESIASTAPSIDAASEGERNYYVIYEQESELCQRIAAGYTSVLDIIKVHYEAQSH